MPRFIPLVDREETARIIRIEARAQSVRDRTYLAFEELVEAHGAVAKAFDILERRTDLECTSHKSLEIEIEAMYTLFEKISAHMHECESRESFLKEPATFSVQNVDTMIRDYFYIFPPLAPENYTPLDIARQSSLCVGGISAFCFRHFARWLKDSNRTVMNEYEIKRVLENAHYSMNRVILKIGTLQYPKCFWWDSRTDINPRRTLACQTAQP